MRGAVHACFLLSGLLSHLMLSWSGVLCAPLSAFLPFLSPVLSDLVCLVSSDTFLRPGAPQRSPPSSIGLGLVVLRGGRPRAARPGEERALGLAFSPRKGQPRNTRHRVVHSQGWSEALEGWSMCHGDGTYSGPRGLDIWPWPRNKQRLHKILGFKPKNQRPLSTLFAPEPYYLLLIAL